MHSSGCDLLAAIRYNAEVWKAHKSGDHLLIQGYLRTIRPSDSTGTDIINGWQPMEFARPSLLVPTTQPNGPLFAFPYEVPQPALDSAQFNADVDKEVSHRSVRGMLWIPFAGTWWVRYDAITAPLVVAQLDDICGACAEQMRRPGVTITDSDPVTVLAANATNLVPDNQRRDGVVIHNVGGSDIWVRLKEVNGGTQDAVVGGPGFVIPPGETLALVGDLAWRGWVNAIADGANGEAYVMQVYA